MNGKIKTLEQLRTSLIVHWLKIYNLHRVPGFYEMPKPIKLMIGKSILKLPSVLSEVEKW